jgi:hypothetical protein
MTEEDSQYVESLRKKVEALDYAIFLLVETLQEHFKADPHVLSRLKEAAKEAEKGEF